MKHRFHHRALCILVSFMLIAACQSTPSLPDLELDEFISQLDTTEVPFTTALIDGATVIVYMDYGVESNPPSQLRYTDDVIVVVQTMCNFAYGYSLKAEYSDKISTFIDWRLIRDYCGGTLASDKLLSEFKQPTSISP
jgi:hypothetical protein